MSDLKGHEAASHFVWRTYHHAGGARKTANTYRDDAEEARQYCASFSTNRKGGIATVPSSYDDVKIRKKHDVKPKDKKGLESIRTNGKFREETEE